MRCKCLLLSLASAGLVLVAACSTSTTQEPPEIATPEVTSRPLPAPPVAKKGEESRREMAADQMAVMTTQQAAAGAMKSKRMVEATMGYAPSAAPAIGCCWQPQQQDREQYASLAENPLQRAAEQPVSTFSIDVDTGSYSNVRRFLNQGRLPPEDAVRVEEMINYFDYAAAPPRDRAQAFGVETEIAPNPWNAKTRLLRIGIQGWKPQGPRKASNLVFLVDVSGSMGEPNKLPLVKSALKLLAQDLTAADRVSLVVYAGASGVVLEPTPGDRRASIAAALDRLEAGGSTNGGEGIRLAYAMAEQAFIRGGNNRVLLATDGDFNVGTVNFEQLIDLVEEKRKSGVALTTLGFGAGNYNDHLMEQLADAGNGNHGYIDTLAEARRLLVEQRDATLQTIARDVKIQVEFNPALVAEYRLIGYENRQLRREDFSNDKVDAGEIGAGHRVTALYEIALKGEGGERIEPPRYGGRSVVEPMRDELAYLRLRYKRPEDGMSASSRLIEQPILRSRMLTDIGQASDAFRLSAAVAAFGQLLRGGRYTEGFGYTEVLRLARGARGMDARGDTGEFIQLVQLADSLSAQQASVSTGD
jgi:Ca-activated chloride channel family protein